MTTFTGTISAVAPGDTTTLSTKLATHSDALKALTEAWTSWTPTITAETGTFTTTSSSQSGYLQAGKLVIWRVTLTLTTIGTASGAVRFTLPVAPNASHAYLGVGRESASTGSMLTVFQVGGAGSVYRYDNASIIAAGRILTLSGQYEAA